MLGLFGHEVLAFPQTTQIVAAGMASPRMESMRNENQDFFMALQQAEWAEHAARVKPNPKPRPMPKKMPESIRPFFCDVGEKAAWTSWTLAVNSLKKNKRSSINSIFPTLVARRTRKKSISYSPGPRMEVCGHLSQSYHRKAVRLAWHLLNQRQVHRAHQRLKMHLLAQQ